MPHRSLSLFVTVVLLGFGMVGTLAAPAADPTTFVGQLVHEGLRTLNDKQLSAQAREQRFANILDHDFDFPRIARFVLGRYWSGASETDRQQFLQVFGRWVIRTYSARLAEYGGETVKITGSRPESETTFLVACQVLRDPPIKLDWRVRREGDAYKVVDVDVDGVSLLLTQREEFASVIQRNGGTVAGLTRTLEERMASGNAQGGVAAPR